MRISGTFLDTQITSYFQEPSKNIFYENSRNLPGYVVIYQLPENFLEHFWESSEASTEMFQECQGNFCAIQAYTFIS